jgi:hypothetical protein
LQLTSESFSFLRAQLEGLESIFFELIPFGVQLKRQDIQEFYDSRMNWIISATSASKSLVLRRQFSSKANRVRNIVDGAETLGNAQLRFNLIFAGSSLPRERQKGLRLFVREICEELVENNSIEVARLREILDSNPLTPVEARVLLGSAMFLANDEVILDGEASPTAELLENLLRVVEQGGYLASSDPFRTEAKVFACALARSHGSS